MKTKAAALLLALALGVPLQMYAQGTTGRLSGVVTDESGALIPGATVKITNMSTAASKSYVTNADGVYEFPFLPLGRYEVEVRKSGFSAFVQTGVEITGAVPVELSVKLEIGKVSETVEVRDTTPMLQTGTASTGKVVETIELDELPIFQRDPLLILNVIPGSAVNETTATGSGAAIRVNGSRMGTSQFSLDGISINTEYEGYSGGQDVAMAPDIEALSEYGVITNNFSAEFGRAQGAVVLMNMKSGTNAFHGDIYEYWENAALNAANILETTVPKPPNFANTFGGTLGGPIIRNKLFFFFAYQGVRNLVPVEAEDYQVPTAKMRAGDFSELDTPIFDPATTQPQAPYGRQQFPGNIIPTDRLNKSGVLAAATYPLPNLPGIGANWLVTPDNKSREDQSHLKIDYNIGSKDHLYGRWTRDPTNGSTQPVFPGVGNTSGATSLGHNNALQFNEVHTFSANFLNEFRVGYQHTNLLYGATLADTQGYTGTQIGIPSNDPLTLGFPEILITGCYSCTLGNPNPIVNFKQSVYEFDDAMTLIKGRQSLKFGATVRRIEAFDESLNCPAGCYSFDASFDDNPANSADVGNGFADLLLGMPISVTQQFITPTDFHYTEVGAFLQDDVKVNRKLTLNLGVRWDYFGALREAEGRVSEYDPALNLIVEKNPLSTPNKHLFVPRIGLAYQITPKTVFRTAFGISTSPQLQGIGLQIQGTPPYARAQTIQNLGTYYSTLTVPAYPFGQELPALPQQQFPLSPQPTVSAPFFPDFIPTPYWQMWNVTIQHQLKDNVTVGLGYVGTRGVHLDSSNEVNSNLPPASEYGPDNLFGGLTFQERKPYPDMGPLTEFGNRASSEYSGLQATAAWRYKNGLWFSAAYSWEKAMTDMPGRCCNEEFRQGVGGTSPQKDISNWRTQWAPDGSTPYHVFVLQANYELPFGPGKEFLGQGRLGRVIGGWQLGGSLLLRDGDQFGVSSADALQHVPDRICNGNIPRSQRTFQRYFDTSCFVDPSPIYSLGNAGFAIINGPRDDNLDASLFKNFKLVERLRAQLRLDVYDFTNTPHEFLGRGVTLGTTTFGTFTEAGSGERGLTIQPQRTMQLSLKFIF
jgi:hypothetical protein